MLDNNVDLTKGQDDTQCVPFYSIRTTATVSDGHQYRQTSVSLSDNGGTANVSATRGLASGTIVVDIFVVEFTSAITVQKVGIEMTGTSQTAAITAVTLANAFCVFSYRSRSTVSDDFDEGEVSHEFSAVDEITIARNNSVGTVNGAAYVVECSSGEFTVQHITVSTGAGDNDTITGTISSAVVLADTFLIHSYQTDTSSDNMLQGIWAGDIQNTTTVRSRRSINDTTSTAAEHRFQVVECNNNEWDVQRNAAWTLSATSQTDTITEVATSRTMVQQLHGGTSVGRNDSIDGLEVDNVMSAVDLSSSTAVRAQLRATATDTIISYEVVQFVPSGAAGSLVNREMVNTLVNGGLVS